MIQKALVIPKIKITHANALSSPFTVGFPAMTAWLGAMHALQRKLTNKLFPDFRALRVGVIANQFQLRAQKDGYVTSLIGERHPLKKDGKSPSFVEEPKCHLTVSLVVEYQGIDPDQKDEFIATVSDTLHRMRLASGMIQSFETPESFVLDKHSDDHDTNLRKLTSKLMPGYALIERRDLMKAAMAEGVDAMQSLINAVAVTSSCSPSEPTEGEDEPPAEWRQHRQYDKGWIVPIATGFQGLTDASPALNQRDPDTPHRFAEAIVTLGEFKMPHRIQSLDEILWKSHYDSTTNLYTCKQS